MASLARLLSVAGVAVLCAPALAQESKLVRALDGWWKAYRRGAIDMRRWEPDSSEPFVRRYGIDGSGLWVSPLRDLQLLLDAAAAENSAALAERVLRVAGVGLDRERCGLRHAPAIVRAMAERALDRMTAAPVRRALLARARAGGAEDAMRAAALRSLGQHHDELAHATLVDVLGEPEPQLRLAAAEGLRRQAAPQSVAPLVAALRSERDERVRIALANALRDVLDSAEAAVPIRVVRDAASAVLEALGAGGWRSRLALLELLQRWRMAATVPVLIDLLAACDAPAAQRDDEAVSGTLRARVHELLIDLTGARFPIDRPDQWREFWKGAAGGFRAAARVADAGATHTVSQGFFGIDVRGLRVVFVIDVSLSMAEPYPTRTAAGDDRRALSKLAVAKTELLNAIGSLPAEASFNIVLFAGGVTRWKDGPVAATVANRNAAAQYVRGFGVQSATDIWGGMQSALRLQSLVYGDRYESNVDEVFLLSDGWPTAGDLLNPAQILATIDDTNRFSRVRINTVYLGTIGDVALHAGQGMLPGADWMAPEEMMAQLAAHNGGRHVRPR
jgi:hypothetical protein